MANGPLCFSTRIKSQSGMATVIALLLVGLLTLIGLIAISTSDDEVTIASNELQELKAFYAAEAGLEKASSLVEANYELTGLPPSLLQSGTATYNNCDVQYATTDDGPPKLERLQNGPMAGMFGTVKSYTVTSVSSDPVDRASIEMSQSFEAVLVPIFQFAVFYEQDLLMSPRRDMTLGGRVHVNGDMWVQAFQQLIFDGAVSSGGHIFHGLPDVQGWAHRASRRSSTAARR